MPEIAIKQTLSNQSFKDRLDESGQYMRRWGQNAVKDFEAVKQAASDAAKWDSGSQKWVVPSSAGPRSEQFAWASAMAEAGRTGRPSTFGGGQGMGFLGPEGGGGGLSAVGHQLQSVAGAAGMSGLSTAIGAAMNPATLGITAAVGGIAAFTHGVIQAAEESKRLADQADRMGMSLNGFETLSILAKSSSIDVGQLGTSVMRLNKNLGEGLEDPSSKAAKAVAELGMSLEHVTSMSPEDAFTTLGTAVGAIQDKFQRARIEVALFGRSGQELDQILRKMAAGGMDEAAGRAVSAFDRAVLAEAGETLEKLGMGWNKFWTSIKANAAEAFGLVDMEKVQGRLKPPAIATPADKEAEHLRQVREEIDRIADSGKSAREKFIERFHPDAASLAAWDAVNDKIKQSKDAGDKAAGSIERMGDAIRKMRAEMEGLAAPNKELEDFTKGRKYKDADIQGIQSALEDKEGAMQFALIDLNKAVKAGGSGERETQVVEGFQRKIEELRRKLADAMKERDQAKNLADMPAEAEGLKKDLAARQQADAAAKSWQDRLRAATEDADELAAKLISGSAEFAGNLDQARKYIREVKEAEQSRKANEGANRFEEAMRDELLARGGETSREAQLRHLVEGGGLSRDRAESLAQGVAYSDAASETDKLASRWRQFAPSADQGSSEAYNILHQPAAMSKDEKQSRLQELTNSKLDEMNRWLQRLYNGQATPAAAP